MTEKTRVFESEIKTGKLPKLKPASKLETPASRPEAARQIPGQKSFSRETVQRLINWFKQE
jgi:hypothetical protein